MESIGGVGGVCVEFMSGMEKQEVGEGKVCVEVMSWMGRQEEGGSLCRCYDWDGETTGGGGGQ